MFQRDVLPTLIPPRRCDANRNALLKASPLQGIYRPFGAILFGAPTYKLSQIVSRLTQLNHDWVGGDAISRQSPREADTESGIATP